MYRIKLEREHFIDLIQLSVLLVTFLFILPILHQKSKKPHLIISPQNEVVNIAPSIIKVFSLGKTNFISSLLWIETMLRSDYEHYKGSSLENWMYLRLNTITELSPDFFEAYFYGGMYLSIIKDDEVGAKSLFDKGLIRFPHSYPLLFQAGFHYFSELGDLKRAIEIFEKAIGMPEMHPFLPSLVARLKSNIGNLPGAKKVLIYRLNSLPPDTDVKIVERLKDSLYAVQAEMDLKCLNDQKENCNLKDLEGNYYLKKKNKYFAPKPWKPFRIMGQKKSEN